MLSSTRFPNTFFKSSMAVLSALTLAFGLSVPRAAQADLGDAIGVAIVGGAVICLTNPQLCGGNNGRQAGPSDAAGLSRSQAMWVQSGLQNLGFYTGAIDGALGAGSRAAIRQYQASIGEPATGAMTGTQLNDLVRLSAEFYNRPEGDPYLFNADLAQDLSRAEVQQLQSALNQRGYAAGVVDGAAGGRTRQAIAAYKAANGLPGTPLATRRLLAHITGQPAPIPAGIQFSTFEGAEEGMVEPAKPMPMTDEISTTMGATDLSYDINGASLGMSEAQVAEALSAAMGRGLQVEHGDAASFGGTDVLSRGSLTAQSGWPTPPAEEVLALYDSARPDLGLVAVFRVVELPAAVDQAVFDAQILPDIITKYGADTMLGDGLWIGSAAARDEISANPAKLAECGALGVKPASDVAMWSAGGGLQLDAPSLDSVKADCGEVLSVRYDDAAIYIGLWNSGLMSQTVVAPKISF
jgi:peptidoglycan hydrolase-like protein with peptidoglycan-binding domain